MIELSRIDTRVKSRLEAEGTDHWRLDLDRIPSLNGAQWLVQSAVNSLMDSTKGIGEALRDLNKTVVVQTSVNGRVELDRLLAAPPLAHRLWTVLGVYPEIMPAATLQPDPLPNNSRLRSDLRMAYPLKSATRWTQQQWAMMRDDVFAAGNSRLTGQLKTWGWFMGTDQVTSVGQVTGTELVIVDTNGQRIIAGISYLKVPEEVPVIPNEDDTQYASWLLEWPESMLELLVAVTLRILHYRQGDGTTVSSLSTQEMAMLMQALG